MANKLSLDCAMEIIPSFAGGSESELPDFFNRCEFVFKHVDKAIKPIILDGIVFKLTDSAKEAVRCREIMSWEQLKTHLSSIFGKTRPVLYLQIYFMKTKQYEKESVQEYANKLKKFSYELTNALATGKPKEEAIVIAKTVQKQALSIFIAGIHYYKIRLILKATNVDTFEKAVLLAVEEEQLIKKIERTSKVNT